MRIFDPKNEFGQSLFCNANVVKGTEVVSGTISGGKITIADKSTWILVKASVNGIEGEFYPDVTVSGTSLVVVFAEGASELDGKKATMVLRNPAGLSIKPEKKQND